MYYDPNKITQVGRIVNWLLPEKGKKLRGSFMVDVLARRLESAGTH